ncbi:MAG: UDP-N-acetylmuramoyl-L-alanine--D-glutamate ligase [Candidatus Aminicenantes bacterium]|nr:UDP-N-acetylmuramoyl-L-alanine--D-glutamate ligase [Candidatus Aminicenantes bacterium]
MDLKNKNILVVGFGKTGKAVCDFLINQNKPMDITVTESKNSSKVIQEIIPYQKRGIRFEIGGHKLPSFLEADLIVPSPGVPPMEHLQEAARRDIPILSEVELAFRFLQGTIIGITGSNGKSTVTSLVHNILRRGGLKSHLAGNIGTPLISFTDKSSEKDIFVTELSSFQLHYIRQFAPEVSVILNITPDHLDWHGSFSSYQEAKIKMIKNQSQNQTAVLNRDDPRVWEARGMGPERILSFSRKQKVSHGCFVHSRWMVLNNQIQNKVLNTKDIPLMGIHNQENIMASILCGHVFGVPLDTIRQTIMDFKGLEHRLEKVMSVNGVTFYNDSKATNVDAALKSIMSFDKKISLIMGGRDKGGDFSRLNKEINKRVQRVIVIGEAKDKIIKSLGEDIEIQKAASLKQAVELGFANSKPGDIVLLAPACTSFDMFENFEHRGRAFKQEVQSLFEQTDRTDS